MARPFMDGMTMSKKEIIVLLASMLLLGSVALWGAITAIDTYAFSDDASDAAPVLRPR
jgi:hypothetical protein